MPNKYQPIGTNMTPSRTKLGKFLRARRLELGLNQEQVAQCAGIWQTTYSQVEIGHRKQLKAGQVDGLARALKCDRSEIEIRLPKKPQLKPKSELGWFIRNRLDELHITDEEFANRLGSNYRGIYHLMYGGRQGLFIQTLQPLAKALEVEAASLRYFLPRVGEIRDNDFGQLVRSRRLELGLSVNQLAERMEVSRQRVEQIEQIPGTLNSSTSTLLRLAVALDLDVAILQSVRPQRKLKSAKSDPTTLGGFLMARRLELGLTQQEVTIIANLKHQSCVSLAEHNKHVPYNKLQAIIQALNCELPPELLHKPQQPNQD